MSNWSVFSLLAFAFLYLIYEGFLILLESLPYFSCSIFKMLLNCHFNLRLSIFLFFGEILWNGDLLNSLRNKQHVVLLPIRTASSSPPPSRDPPVKWCVQRVTKFHVYFALCLGCIFCSFDVFVDSCLVTLNHSKSRIFAILELAAYPALYQHFLGSFCAQQF